MKIVTLVLAASFGLATIAPASAAMRIADQNIATSNIVEVGSHGHGYGHKRYHKPRKHRHYHCHRRLVYGYWKKRCHKAWHNRHGRHHTHHYH